MKMLQLVLKFGNLNFEFVCDLCFVICYLFRVSDLVPGIWVAATGRAKVFFTG